MPRTKKGLILTGDSSSAHDRALTPRDDQAKLNDGWALTCGVSGESGCSFQLLASGLSRDGCDLMIALLIAAFAITCESFSRFRWRFPLRDRD